MAVATLPFRPSFLFGLVAAASHNTPSQSTSPQRKPEPSDSQPLPAFSQPPLPTSSLPTKLPSPIQPQTSFLPAALTQTPHLSRKHPAHSNPLPSVCPSHQPSVCAFFLPCFVPRVSRGALTGFFLRGSTNALTHFF